MTKIIGIGLSKTGTSSLHLASRYMGLKGYHNTTEELVDSCLDGNLAPALKLLQHYDCVSDSPFHVIYKEIYKEFPDAYYILTIRKSVEDWLQSMLHHITRDYRERSQRAAAVRIWEKLYGIRARRPDANVLREHYEAHRQSVTSFFETQNSARFVTLCWENDDYTNWEQLCSFLQRPILDPMPPFPNANKRGDIT